MTEKPPRLLDARALTEELGVKRDVAYAIMGRLPAVRIPGIRKTFVRREDLEALLAESTTPAGR